MSTQPRIGENHPGHRYHAWQRRASPVLTPLAVIPSPSRRYFGPAAGPENPTNGGFSPQPTSRPTAIAPATAPFTRHPAQTGHVDGPLRARRTSVSSTPSCRDASLTVCVYVCGGEDVLSAPMVVATMARHAAVVSTVALCRIAHDPLAAVFAHAWPRPWCPYPGTTLAHFGSWGVLLKGGERQGCVSCSNSQLVLPARCRCSCRVATETWPSQISRELSSLLFYGTGNKQKKCYTAKPS